MLRQWQLEMGMLCNRATLALSVSLIHVMKSLDSSNQTVLMSGEPEVGGVVKNPKLKASRHTTPKPHWQLLLLLTDDPRENILYLQQPVNTPLGHRRLQVLGD